MSSFDFKKYQMLSVVLAFFTSTVLISSCSLQSESSNGSTSSQSSSVSTAQTSTVASVSDLKTPSVEYASEDTEAADASNAIQIKLDGSSAQASGKGVSIKNGTITINSAGTYALSGTLSEGQIVVDVSGSGTVKIILNGASISCSNSSAIYVKNADKVVLTLADGTQNTLSDGTNYVFDDAEKSEPDAALFSKSNLTINGTGTLTINANYNDGITSKDELRISSGNIIINSTGDGIKGRDFVSVKDGNISVSAQNDGIKSTNDEDAEKGFVLIEGGKLNIICANDGIQAETTAAVTGGEISITSGGGSSNGVSQTVQQSTEETESKKGIKATSGIVVNGGEIGVNSADDSVHSNGNIKISSGTLTISSGDDGIHADGEMVIDNGEISISKSYEGLESSVMTINNGNIYVVSSDDGINIAGGNDGSSINGRPGQNEFANSTNNQLYINGGYISINASGDGLDSNGSITMTNGTVIVNGPENDGNGAMDYNGTFKMDGGWLLAVGSSGMAQAPSDSSLQYSLMINFDSKLSAGTLVHLQTSSGEEIFTFAPFKTYQSVVFCSPEIKEGTYSVYTGGTSTGTNENGLYTGGNYSGGSEYKSFEVSSKVTTVGQAPKMGGGPGRMGGNPDGRRKFQPGAMEGTTSTAGQG